MLKVVYFLGATLLPACPTEDSDFCYWYAHEQGTSFVAVNNNVGQRFPVSVLFYSNGKVDVFPW